MTFTIKKYEFHKRLMGKEPKPSERRQEKRSYSEVSLQPGQAKREADPY